MYLKVQNTLRPFNEAWATITYEPVYDLRKRVIQLKERWEIEGRVVLQSGTQGQMTLALSQLDRDFSQYEPDLVFVEDDGVTESFMRLKSADCLQGPYMLRSSFPHNNQNIYATGESYSITFEGIKRVPGTGGLVSFTENLQKMSGGTEIVFVGGAINYAERQIAKQHAPYMYRQSGSAVGLYGWPVPPPPIWPSALLGEAKVNYVSPRELGRVNMYYEVQWTYEFGNEFALAGRPHSSI